MAQRSPEDEQWYHWHLLTLLSVSAAMVGVCLTGIGLVGIIKTLRNEWQVFADGVLAISALLFVGCSFLSFLGIRTRIRKKWAGFSLAVDILFCLGLLALVSASMLLTWALI